MFKWLIKWFDTEFPSIKDEPRAIVVPEPTPSHIPALSIDEQERAMGIPEYQRNQLKKLRKFLKILSEKEIVGWNNNLKVEKDDDDYRSFMYKTHYNVKFYASDRTEFELRMWYPLSAGTIHFLTFSAYQVITAVAQGHLFDDPTILREAEYKNLVNESLAYGNKEEHAKYLRGVINRTIDHVEVILEELPIMEERENTTPVFHKLWEQMDLPLDTGKEMVKL